MTLLFETSNRSTCVSGRYNSLALWWCTLTYKLCAESIPNFFKIFMLYVSSWKSTQKVGRINPRWLNAHNATLIVVVIFPWLTINVLEAEGEKWCASNARNECLDLEFTSFIRQYPKSGNQGGTSHAAYYWTRYIYALTRETFEARPSWVAFNLRGWLPLQQSQGGIYPSLHVVVYRVVVNAYKSF